jgi:hypothetical protein
MAHFRRTCAGVLMVVLTGAGCSSGTPTTPAGSTAVTTNFSSRILIGGAAWRSFNQTSTSIVTARLAILSPESDAVVRIGFGTFDGTTCTSTTTVDTAANDTDPQLSAALTPGRYCVQIWDIGNLTTINDFLIVVIQP